MCITNTHLFLLPANTGSSVFPIPGVSLKHSASSGHSDLKCLLLPAVLETGEDGSQGSCTELGSPRAHSRTYVLHELGI